MMFRKSGQWEVFREVLAQMHRYFLAITTMLVIFNGILHLGREVDWVTDGLGMLRFPIAAFTATLPMLLFVFFESKTARGSIILQSVHAFATAAFVAATIMILGVSSREALVRNAIVFFLFFVVSVARVNIRNRQFAAKINKRLETLHHEENATCEGENATYRD